MGGRGWSIHPVIEGGKSRDDSKVCAETRLRMSRHSLEREAFGGCHDHMRQYLNVHTIFPQLCQELLTDEERQMLALETLTDYQKVDNLMIWLPRKRDFFQKFIRCLEATTDGTNHGELANILRGALDRLAADRDTPIVSAGDDSGSEDGGEETRTLLVPAEGHPTPQLEVRVPPPHPTFWQCSENKTKRVCYCCWFLVLVAIVVSVALLAGLAFLPSTERKVEPAYVWEEDTVELHFNLDNSWLDHVSMSISHCSGPLYVLPGSSCSHLYSQLTYYSWDHRHGFYPGPTYLLPGSSINFSIPEDVESDTKIWIFSKRDTFVDFIDNPQDYNCNAFPSGTDCIDCVIYAGRMVWRPINSPGYYQVYTQDSLLHGITWTYHKRQYDYTKLSPYKPVLTLSDRTETLKLSSYFQYGKSCVILHILDTDLCTDPGYGKLHVEEVKRRSDILIFPGILLLLSLIAAVPLTAITIWRCCRQGRRQE